MRWLSQKVNMLYAHMAQKTDEVRHRIALFGLVMMINYPLFGVFWKIDRFQPTEEFWLRLIATFLSACLCFNYFWPKRLSYLLPIFWYCGLLFCLPFFFSYMTLMNHASTLWLMNCVTAIFFLSLLMGVIDSLIFIFVGGGLALLVFCSNPNNVFLYMPGNISGLGILVTFAAAILISTFFAHDRETYYAKKLMGFNAMADHLAEDLQKPLTHIHLETAKQARVVDKLEDLKLQGDLKGNLKKIEEYIDASNRLITDQLKNIKKQTWDPLKFRIHSIEMMLSSALSNSESFKFDTDRVRYQKDDDFLVWIDDQSFQEMIWRLYKQSFSHIVKGQDICIEIMPQKGHEGDNYNYLFIKKMSKKIPVKSTEQMKTFFYGEKREKESDLSWLDAYKPLLHAAGGNVSVQSAEDGLLCVEIKFPKVD